MQPDLCDKEILDKLLALNLRAKAQVSYRILMHGHHTLCRLSKYKGT
jgi:hypothetical protein